MNFTIDENRTLAGSSRIDRTYGISSGGQMTGVPMLTFSAFSEAVSHLPGYEKLDDLRKLWPFIEQDVHCLQVPVDDCVGMQEAHPVGDLAGDYVELPRPELWAAWPVQPIERALPGAEANDNLIRLFCVDPHELENISVLQILQRCGL
jgi:hypothetical protein